MNANDSRNAIHRIRKVITEHEPGGRDLNYVIREELRTAFELGRKQGNREAWDDADDARQELADIGEAGAK